MNHVSISATDVLSANTPLHQTPRANNYAAIEQPDAHVAVQINNLPSQQRQTLGSHAYHALQGGALGALVSGAIGAACTFLASQGGSDNGSVGMAATAITLFGAAGGAVLRVRQMQSREQYVRTLHNEIKAYRDRACADWVNEPGHANFRAWFDQMIDTRLSLEFKRRPQHVMDKLTDILAAAGSNEALRARLYDIAAETLADCHDRTAFGMKLMLNDICDTRMLERGDGTEAFLARGKVAHYDAILEQVAHYIAANPGPEEGLPFDRPDDFGSEPLELYAYYANRLGPELGLTDTVRHNTATALYGFTTGYADDEVRQMVSSRAEEPGALQNFLKTGWPSWVRHLEHEKPAWFQEIDNLMLERMDEITAEYDARRAGPSGEAGEHNSAAEDMHRELAASERGNSRQRLVDALTDHYVETKDLDAFDFDGWMEEDKAAYEKREQAFINNPEAFAYLRASSAGSLIGQY